jgi:hypothetical protein
MGCNSGCGREKYGHAESSSKFNSSLVTRGSSPVEAEEMLGTNGYGFKKRVFTTEATESTENV